MIYLTYMAALGVAAVIPGPGVSALIGQALGGSRISAMAFLAGICLGDVMYLTFAILGLSGLAHNFSEIFIALKLLGGAYLIYIAYQFWTSEAKSLKVKTQSESDLIATFIRGFLVTAGNPKTIVFYLAILPSVMSIDGINFATWFVLAVLTIFVLFAVLSPYAFLASRAKTFFTKPKALRKLNQIAASFIGTAGLIILLEALKDATKRI